VKELLEPIVYVALTIFAIGAALMTPMLVYYAYIELIKGRND
jgi:hypothetical protein